MTTARVSKEGGKEREGKECAKRLTKKRPKEEEKSKQNMRLEKDKEHRWRACQRKKEEMDGVRDFLALKSV